MASKYYQRLLWIVVVVFYAWTFYLNKDLFTWCLEVSPAVLGAIVIITTYRRFPLSNLSYTLIAVHAMILAYGGAYTYAETPFGFWLSEIFGWSRNNYDKIGHFMQGFGPVIWGREILIRLSPLGSRLANGRYSKWLPFLTVSTVLGFAAFYEFVEWWISLVSGSAGDAFLGTQGYIWDTQSDMLLGLIGGIVGYIVLCKLHDRSISKLLKQ